MSARAISIEDLRCCVCGSDKPVAFLPGSKDERVRRVLIARGQPVLCWCMSCWGRVVMAA